MSRSLNPRVLKTVRELSEDEVVRDFIEQILQEESIHMADDKHHWHYSEYYKREIAIAIKKYNDLISGDKN